jgi:hypothetical protein
MRCTWGIVAVVAVGIVVTSPARIFAQQTHHIRHILDQVEPDLNFTNVSFSDAIDFLRISTDANVVVDWKALEAVNITPDALINVRLRNVTLRKALNVILSEAGAGNLLTFYMDQNVLEITTQAKADTILYTMVYPVKDLLLDIPNYQVQDIAQTLNALNTGGGNIQAGSQGGGGQGSNINLSSASSVSSTNTTATMDQNGQALAKMIMDIIRPEIWRANGGNSNITYFHGDLIVTAPLSVQEAIGGPVD